MSFESASKNGALFVRARRTSIDPWKHWPGNMAFRHVLNVWWKEEFFKSARRDLRRYVRAGQKNTSSYANYWTKVYAHASTSDQIWTKIWIQGFHNWTFYWVRNWTCKVPSCSSTTQPIFVILIYKWITTYSECNTDSIESVAWASKANSCLAEQLLTAFLLILKLMATKEFKCQF